MAFQRLLLRGGAVGSSVALGISTLSQRLGSSSDAAASPFSGGETHAPAAETLDGLQFDNKTSFRGQLTPLLLSDSQGLEHVAEHSGVLWQRGPYNSWWLRLGVNQRPLPSHEKLVAVIEEVISRAKAVPDPGAAVYIGVQELTADSSLLGLLRARGFQFHHFHVSESSGARSTLRPGEFVYYRWLGDQSHDLVPSYGTSIEGVGAVCLSPDEKKVLLIWEYGNWKLVTGAVDTAESKWESLQRELHEEVGSKLDLSFTPRYLGGWQLSAARDNAINDNFSTFAVRATSEELTLDPNEVAAAQWFDIEQLLQIWHSKGAPGPGSAITVGESDGMAELSEVGRARISTNGLAWLAAYKAGASLRVSIEPNGTSQNSTRVLVGGLEPTATS